VIIPNLRAPHRRRHRGVAHQSFDRHHIHDKLSASTPERMPEVVGSALGADTRVCPGLDERRLDRCHRLTVPVRERELLSLDCDCTPLRASTTPPHSIGMLRDLPPLLSATVIVLLAKSTSDHSRLRISPRRIPVPRSKVMIGCRCALVNRAKQSPRRGERWGQSLAATGQPIASMQFKFRPAHGANSQALYRRFPRALTSAVRGRRLRITHGPVCWRVDV
jgi:hypothetical protein